VHGMRPTRLAAFQGGRMWPFLAMPPHCMRRTMVEGARTETGALFATPFIFPSVGTAPIDAAVWTAAGTTELWTTNDRAPKPDVIKKA
jgi:hypothetical protein